MIYDIDLNLKKLSTGAVATKQGAEAVSQIIENLLLTRKGEKPFNSTYGTNIPDYLEEPVSVLNALSIRDEIYNVISNFFKWIVIDKNDIIITINNRYNFYKVDISYSENTTEQQQSVFLQLQANRV